ncbi:hypothetical protein AM587_10001357 [Phytophthora nicotianae]|uniref:Uncharacterized protein n=1 Tax=Phytophthora nicotianae TaxID=4792 RepID=A0A0W8DZJ0_PHYNI|nr:hypothetical protein AM587_10001357 [Phytophthora nicotianae]
MYDLHYAAEGEYEASKQSVLDKWEQLPSNSAEHAVGHHIKTIWVNSAEFGNWQVFHTPTGCATTNNPLEQYHRTLKINCDNPRATPFEMMESMERAFLSFVSEGHVFSNTPQVSDRLHKLYKTLVERRCISATQLPTGRSQNEVRFAVKQQPLPVNANVPKQYDQSIGSVNARRMQMQDMPSDGWVVVPGRLQCDCCYCWKHGVCPHIIDACTAAGVPCPRLTPSPRRFVTNARRSRPPARRGGAARRLQLNQASTNASSERSDSSVTDTEALDDAASLAVSDPATPNRDNQNAPPLTTDVDGGLVGVDVTSSDSAGPVDTSVSGDDDDTPSGSLGVVTSDANADDDMVRGQSLPHDTATAASSQEASSARHPIATRANRAGKSSARDEAVPELRSVASPTSLTAGAHEAVARLSAQRASTSKPRRTGRRRRPTTRAAESQEQARKRTHR